MTSGTDGSEDNSLESKVKVGVLVNDGSVVATELEEGLAETVLHVLADDFADSFGTGKADHLDIIAGDQSFADIPVTADQGSDRSGQTVPLENGRDQLGDSDRDERSGGRGLPEGGVASSDGDGEVPTVDGDGEVEGRKDGDRAEGIGDYISAP